MFKSIMFLLFIFGCCYSTHHKQVLDSKCPLRIFSFDGGGVRGIISASILDVLEQIIGNITGIYNISQYVDVVGGTSAGGLNALGLLNGYSAQQNLNWSLTWTPKIFSSSMRRRMPSTWAKYDPSNLEKGLKSMLGNKTISSLGRYNTSFTIVSFDISNYTSLVFTPEHKNQLAWEVGRCTSAAPTLFPTYIIKKNSSNSESVNITCLDGGVTANNPENIVLNHALGKYQMNPNKTVMISFGTGIPDTPVQGYHDWGYVPWYENNILDLLTLGPQYSNSLSVANLYFTTDPKRYLRINYKKSTKYPLKSCQKANFGIDVADPNNLELLRQCGYELAKRYYKELLYLAKLIACL